MVIFMLWPLPLGNTTLWFITNRIYSGSFQNDPNILGYECCWISPHIFMLGC